MHGRNSRALAASRSQKSLAEEKKADGLTLVNGLSSWLISDMAITTGASLSERKGVRQHPLLLLHDDPDAAPIPVNQASQGPPEMERRLDSDKERVRSRNRS